MPTFKLHNTNPEASQLYDGWTSVNNFKSKNRIVDEHGRAVIANYKGRQYQIIEKKERIFSTSERIGRGFLGAIAVICTLSFGLFFKPVRNLFKFKETIRFAIIHTSNSQTQSSTPGADQSSNKPRVGNDGGNEPKPLEQTPPVEPPEPIPVPISTPPAPIREENISPKEPTRLTQRNFEEGQEISTKELETGIEISPEAIRQIQENWTSISTKKQTDEVTFYPNQQAAHLVFALKTEPNLVFKMIKPRNTYTSDNKTPEDTIQSMRQRFENMIKARTTVRTLDLNLLKIPRAKFFTIAIEGQEYGVIAEEKAKINPIESKQQDNFYDHAKALNEAIRQLTIFIIETGFSDLNLTNIPMLEEEADSNGNRKIVLVDLERMKGAYEGLFCDGNYDIPLIRVINQEQREIVFELARYYNISFKSTSMGITQHTTIKDQELEEEVELRNYYQQNGCKKGDEKLPQDLQLNFSKYPNEEKDLQSFTKLLIKLINKKLEENLKSKQNESFRIQRSIFIPINNLGLSNKSYSDGWTWDEINTTAPKANQLITTGKPNPKWKSAFDTPERDDFLGYALQRLKDLQLIYRSEVDEDTISLGTYGGITIKGYRVQA